MNIFTFRTQRKSQKGLVQLLRQGNLLRLYCLACLSLLLWAQGTQAQTVTTYATGFNNPGRVSFDAAGNMYVPELNTGSIKKVTSGGSTTTTLATGMSSPRSIALDATNNLYVTDNGNLGGSSNTSLWKVTPAGVVSTFVNIGASTIGIVKDAAGNFYVTNFTGNDVRKITPDGTITTFATGLNIPSQLDIDAAGNLYVNSNYSRKILKVTPAGVVSTFYDYSASGASCNGVALDAAGNVYLSFGLSDRSQFPPVTSYSLKKVDASGTNISTFVDFTTTMINDVAYWDNNLYVSSGTNILKVSLPSSCTNPTAYNVTGGGSYCAGGTGVAIGLSNSETGVTYQLKNSTGNVGSPVSGTGAAISFDNQTVAETYTVEATRTTGGCTATMTGSVTVSITPTVTPSVTIASNDADNSITAGTSVTFTATPTNGGTTPSYQWKKGSTNVGTNSATYTDAALANGDVISCVMTSNDPCASPTTATSNNITMTVTAPCIPNGEIWTSRTSATGNDWRSVTYGNGLFVAVASTGSGNRVMTSPDGITWTSRTSAADNLWTCVTYGNGLFVAVAATGSGNRVMTSPDGITWTSRTSAADNAWLSVTYANGLFVAVAATGSGNRVMTSPDGITWTSRTSANNEWSSVIYGNGLFVAVATTGTGNRIMTSPDGITWTSRTSTDNDWTSVTYGNGLFVAVAATGTNPAMTSSDGITWTTRNATTIAWRSVTYGNGLFVAVSASGSGNRVMTSPDGSTWTNRTSPVDNSWWSVTYGNGLFVTVALNGTGDRVMTSSAGIVVGVSIAANPTGSITAGTSVTFTATPTNGGSTPAYQWKKNGNNVGANSATYTDAALADGDKITCMLTSNDVCASLTTATSNEITTAVCTPPMAYSVTGGGSYCAGGTGVAIGLYSSETGVTYQLKNSTGNVGSPVSGTGAAISFGNQTAAETYTVEATRTSGGCKATMTGSVTVIAPTAIVFGTPSVTNVSCNGGSNGSVTISATGGTGAITYTISPNTGIKSGGTFSGLTPQTYTFTATDENGCTKTVTATVTEPTAIVFGTPSVTNVKCLGGNSGKVVVSATGGTGAITYTISPNIGSQSPSGTFNNLTAQTYTFTATDANGCTKTTTATVGTNVNTLPTVTLTSPTNGATLVTNTTLTATASDPDGTISQVNFYLVVGITKTGAASRKFLGSDNTAPYSYEWRNLVGGNYNIQAEAVDDCGEVTYSSIVNVNILETFTVLITSPTNGEALVPGSNITIAASVLAFTNRTITKVEFYSGSTKLGEDFTAPYTYDWNNVPSGNYLLSAKATDNMGGLWYSPSYFFTVNASGIGVRGQFSVSGSVLTENNIIVNNASVLANMNGIPASGSNVLNGVFNITSDTAENMQVRIVKNNNEDATNGVTTYDIAKVSQHILNIEALATPYKIIAADVDRSGEIDATDMIYMRRFILRMAPSLPGGNFRFVDKAYSFRNAANPFRENFREVVSIASLTSNVAANFIAVKLGDVNDSYNALAPRSSRTLSFLANDMDVVAGNEYTVNISADKMDAASFQGTFSFNGATVKSVKAGDLVNMTDGNFGVFANAVTTSWNGKAQTAADVLAITFVATKSGKLSEMLTINSELTRAIANDAAGNEMNVNLKFNTGKVAGGEFALYQNQPNPVANETTIGFNLPKDGTARLTVAAFDGKIVKVINGDYKAGYNTISINKSDLNATGLFYYRLETADHSASKKMVIIE